MANFCRGRLCIAPTYRSEYCDNCLLLRKQHQTSHEMEGHGRQAVLMCPVCDSFEATKQDLGLE